MIVGHAIEYSPEKDAQRGIWKGLVRNYGRKDGYYVILGGMFTDHNNNIIEDSEVDIWLKAGVPANKIVSVECRKKVAERLQKNKAGVEVVYMPLGHVLEEGAECPVPRGDKIGGINRVVRNMVLQGKDIALVNADLMQTADKLHDTVSGIMESLSKQKNDALFFVNINSLRRKHGGKKNVVEALSEYEDFRQQFRCGKFNRAVWTQIGVTINEKHDFEYVSNVAPMQSIFLEKTRNKHFKGERPVKVKTGRRGRPRKIKAGAKDPKMVEAGRKAYATRLKNLRKKNRK